MRLKRRTCVALLGALVLGVGSQDIRLPSASALGRAPCDCRDERGSVLAFGDSITQYTGASDPAHGFTSLLAASLGVGQDNRGSSGDTAAQTVNVIAGAPTPLRYDVVVWLCGFNDNLTAGTDPTALVACQANVEQGLLTLTARRRDPDARTVRERLLLRSGRLGSVADGCDVWVGNCLKPSNYLASGLPTAYRNGSDAGQTAHNTAIATAVANVATAGRRVHLVDVAMAYNTATMVSGDQVHPNDIGHAYIANAFLAALHT